MKFTITIKKIDLETGEEKDFNPKLRKKIKEMINSALESDEILGYLEEGLGCSNFAPAISVE